MIANYDITSKRHKIIYADKVQNLGLFAQKSIKFKQGQQLELATDISRTFVIFNGERLPLSQVQSDKPELEQLKQHGSTDGFLHATSTFVSNYLIAQGLAPNQFELQRTLKIIEKNFGLLVEEHVEIRCPQHGDIWKRDNLNTFVASFNSQFKIINDQTFYLGTQYKSSEAPYYIQKVNRRGQAPEMVFNRLTTQPSNHILDFDSGFLSRLEGFILALVNNLKSYCANYHYSK